MNNSKLLYPKISFEVVGLCFSAHNELGRYSREKQYGDFLEDLFRKNNVQYVREYVIGKSSNRADFLIEDKIILELKVIDCVTREEYYQVQRYLQASDMKLGLLVNFRQKYLRPKRIIKIDTDNAKKFTVDL